MDGDNIKNELSALDHLVDFSAAYLPEMQVKKIRRKLKGSFLSNYVDQQLNAREKRMALRYLVTNLGFDARQYKTFAKGLLGSMGIK